MQRNHTLSALSFILCTILFLSSSCSALATPVPSSTPTLQPTATNTVVPSKTPKPTATPRPTITPNLAATEHMDDLQAEAQSYFDQGYLASADGKFREFDDFNEEWAQLGWYKTWYLNQNARDFYLSAHYKWTSAYRSADISGCGFAFAIQEDGKKYSVFLDRSKVYFVVTDEYYRPFSPTRGTGRVDFGNPFDKAVEADFTLIVKDVTAYVLVDGELVGEYTLSQSRNLRGGLGLTLLSGTNKDFGTRCEMTDIHVWTPWGG